MHVIKRVFKVQSNNNVRLANDKFYIQGVGGMGYFQVTSLAHNIESDILLLPDVSSFATLTVLSNGNNMVNQHAPLYSGEYSLVAIMKFDISENLH